MKKLSGIFIVILVVLISCTYRDTDIKKDFVKDYGCAETVYLKVTNHSISATDLMTVKDLFIKNNISFANLRFTKFDDKDPLNNSATYYVHVNADQYTNGLPIFFSDTGFHFLNGKFYVSIGNKYNEITRTLDTLKYFEPAIVRGLFMTEIKNHKMNENDYTNSCLEIQFGYVDLNAGNSTLAPGNLKKAWFVRTKGMTYPEAIFLDGEGATYYFFDGIIIG